MLTLLRHNTAPNIVLEIVYSVVKPTYDVSYAW